MARLLNGFAGLAAAAAYLVVGKGALAQSALPSGWLDSQVNETGQHCQIRGELRTEQRLLLACGSAGVWEVALAEAGPRFVRSFGFDGAVAGFFTESDGKVWVKVESLIARPLAAGGKANEAHFPEEPAPAPVVPEPPAAAPPPPPSRPAPAVPKNFGRVERVAPQDVLVSLGEDDGVSRSDRVELYLPSSDPDELESSEQLLAVGVVTSVSGGKSKVRIGLNEEVPEGALARLTRSQPTASLAAPPRAGGLWSAEVMARPFAAMEELGGGILLSAAVGRRFTSNWSLRAVLDPAALADVQDRESVSAANFALLGSYDAHYFEMGLGFGAQTVNEPSFLLEPGSGLAVSQLLRLGTTDGLNIIARTSIVLFHSQFEFGGMVATAQIPVSRGFWLQLGGGGGAVGYGYGELGLRVLMAGNGLRGSKFLTVTAGGAGVFEGLRCDPFGSCDSKSYGGPMAGIGSEWRF